MQAILLPVKAFNRSKERLAGFLTPAERQELAATMFQDVWATLLEAQFRSQSQPHRIDHLLVASAEPSVIDLCRKSKVPLLEEEEQLSHSASVTHASRWAMDLGARSLFSLPIDTPGVTAEEILRLVEIGRRFPVVIVPSADGTGTNALLRTPPDAIAPSFGPGSCRLHVAEAKEKNLPCLIFHSPGFAADIDTPEELQAFAANGRPSKTRELALRLLAVHREVPACR